ncbi:hypothetical protein P3T76_002286 [Phytophthora citrophthora]|uniref:Uncharacterized protein n=1 Tax=Phytophthora citrophthora TaxID=4793 RepID=A0AAD9LU35_9STRA|nr:hypothetical protein P3T76_002286 [Phytophthora citrophthora]
MARVDSNMTHLPRILRVDCNGIVCHTTKITKAHTVIKLVAPMNGKIKKLVVSATNVYGHVLKCGGCYGKSMRGKNYDNVVSKVDLGYGSDIAIQFVKASMHGTMTVAIFSLTCEQEDSLVALIQRKS